MQSFKYREKEPLQNGSFLFAFISFSDQTLPHPQRPGRLYTYIIGAESATLGKGWLIIWHGPKNKRCAQKS